MNFILMCLVLAGAASAGRRFPRQVLNPDYTFNFQHPIHEEYSHWEEEREPTHNHRGSFAGASCTLVPSSGQNVNGEIYFRQEDPNGPVGVFGIIHGLSPGYHGFHVHSNGNVSDDCKAAGSHFNPYNEKHGSPTDSVRHVGDLGNILADNFGLARIRIMDPKITLDYNSPRSIVDRTIVVHAKEDDLGKGNDAESLKTGNAGSRVACCVIDYDMKK